LRWLKEVFLNFKRSGFMSLISIGTIVITITMLGGYYMMREAINRFMDRLQNKVEIVVFLKDGFEQGKIDNLITEVKGMPEVSEIRFVSKGDAYQEFVKDVEMKAVLDSYGSNPLPDSIILKLKAYTKPGIARIKDYFREKEGVDEVQYGGEEIENMLNVINVVKLIAAVAGLIFAIASLLVVSNIINLTVYARRQDIYVFRMVGATESYIRMPFITEGIIHGLIGGLVGWGVLYAVITILVSEIRKETGMDLTHFYLLKPYFLSIKFPAACAAAGGALGLLGSLMSQGRSFQ
jgi:cell division transport system permease protein